MSSLLEALIAEYMGDELSPLDNCHDCQISEAMMRASTNKELALHNDYGIYIL